nr:MAG TPA: hypothetical protein [Caudoviricetes sp.]
MSRGGRKYFSSPEFPFILPSSNFSVISIPFIDTNLCG